MRRLPLVTLAALAAGVLGLSAGLASALGSATTPVVFELVPPKSCKPPEVVLGAACAIVTGLVVQDKWNVEDTSANWDVPGQWEIEYQWTVPDKVPETGAKVSLKLVATERIGGANNSVCPGMGLSSGFRVKEVPMPSTTVGFCATAGGTKSGSTSMTLLPSTAAGPGETYYLVIGLQDGPRYTYTYKSVAAKPQTGGATKPGAKRECATIYAVVPTFQKLQANVKLTELSAREKLDLLKKEEAKYNGHPYTPIGPMTRKQNCAGYVLKRLFGSQMIEANVEPDGFFRKVVTKFGTKRASRLTASAGDIVVYRTGNGTVRHVAIVESNGVGRLTILSKDGNERLYRATFPLPGFGSLDPLIQNHADDGTVEFWHVDTSKVKLSVATSDCPKS